MVGRCAPCVTGPATCPTGRCRTRPRPARRRPHRPRRNARTWLSRPYRPADRCDTRRLRHRRRPAVEHRPTRRSTKLPASWRSTSTHDPRGAVHRATALEAKTTSSTPPQICQHGRPDSRRMGITPTLAAATTAWARRTHCLRSATAPISRSSGPTPASSITSGLARSGSTTSPSHASSPGRCSTRSRSVAGVVHGSQARPRPRLHHAAHDPRWGCPSLAAHPSSR